MVATKVESTMLMSSSSTSTSSLDICQPTKFPSRSSSAKKAEALPLRLTMATNRTWSSCRKPRSLSVDFQTLEKKRNRLTIEGVSCKAIKGAVKHLYCLEDFNIEKEPIGCGFYALVYRVFHKVTKQEMVLKMNRLSSIREALLEIQTLNEIQHPNLLKFYGVCVHGGKLWCLTEFVSGGSLDGLIADPRVTLSWTTRIKMALDVAEGMNYLHERSICHRDLTSKNILFREEEGQYTCIVADFGLSLNMKQHATKFETGYMATPYWMAPECLRGKKYTEKADVFSFGIVLGELIARVPADPCYLPRRKDFALDGEALSKIVSCSCPKPFLHLAISCGELLPDNRPSFSATAGALQTLLLRQSYPLQSNNNCDLATIADRFLHHLEPGRSLPSPPPSSPRLDPRRLKSVTDELMGRHFRHDVFASYRRSSGCGEPLMETGERHGMQRHSFFYLDFCSEDRVGRREGTGMGERTRSLPDCLNEH